MAWSGAGTGTISDPYQISSTGQLNEYSIGSTYSASDYFLITNNIVADSSLPLIYFYANLDGSNNKITLPGNRINSNLPSLTIAKSNLVIKNTKFYFNDLISSTPIQITDTLANVFLDNLEFVVNAYYRNLNEENSIITTMFSFDCPSSWTISNIYLEGPFDKIFQNVACSLDNINVLATRSGSIINGFLCNNFTGTDTFIKNCKIKFPSFYFNKGGILCYNISGTRNIIEQNYITGEIKGSLSAPIAYTTKSDTIIKNNYFKGSLIDYGGWNTNGINALVYEYDASLINNYAYIKSITKAAYHYDPSTWFNNLGFTDWYIPSRDEFAILISKGNIPYSANKHDKGSVISGYMTSSEASTNTFYTNYYGGYQASSKIQNDTYYALILVRNFIYSIDDEPTLGQPYKGGYCIYKDNSTLTGMMCAPNWVAEGAKIFNYGSTGINLDTSTGFGTGQNNTNLMIAAATSNQSATHWNGGFSYPNFPAYSSYLLTSNIGTQQRNNYLYVGTKEPSHNISSSTYQLLISDASIRDVSTFSNWDFSTIWHQNSPNFLPTLINNDENAYASIFSINNTALNAFSITLKQNSDIIAFDNSVGLIIKNGLNTIYDSSGLVHNIILSDASDFKLSLEPYYYSGISKIPLWNRDYYFRPYYNVPVTYVPVNKSFILNVATMGVDAKNIHGSLLYNGYIYGCSRTTATIVKIKASDYSTKQYVNISGWPSGFDQIVFCNNYIWGAKGNNLVRIDPSTLSYKTAVFDAFNSYGSEPITCSHNRYLYLTGLQYVYKYDSDYFLGTDISTNCPDSSLGRALMGIYNSFSQGQWISYNNIYPSYIGTTKGSCHSIISDGEYLYIAYTTDYQSDSFIKTSGWIPSIGISAHEMHKVRISNMKADSSTSYKVIPQCTDDMDQDLEYVYLGVEIQQLADPSVYGYGGSILSIRKSDLQTNILSQNENLNPPLYQSFGVFKKGNYIIDQRTSLSLSVNLLTDNSTWSLQTPILKYTKNYLILTGSPGGTPNEFILDYDGYIHAFGWVIVGGSPYPSTLMKYRMPSNTPIIGIPSVKTLDASFYA